MKASQKRNRIPKKVYGTVLSEQPPQFRQPSTASGPRLSLKVRTFHVSRFTFHEKKNASFVLGDCPTWPFYCGERSATICVVLGPLPGTVKREA